MKGVVKILCIVSAVTAAAVVCAQSPSGGHTGIVNAGDAFLEQLQKRDSVLIADQLKYGFRLDNVKAGTVLGLPDLSQGVMDSIEVVSGWKLDTLKRRNHRTEMDIEGSFVITSFDEGRYRLPDIAIGRMNVDGTVDTLVFAGKELQVMSMPVDTSSFKPHDIKGQIRYPVTFREVLPYILAIQLAALIAVLAVSLFMMRRKKAAGEVQSSEPPYIVALKKLDKFRGNKYWAPDKQKQFYSGITDILREYIAGRFGIGAMEMTTAEIFEGLKGKDIPQQLMDEARNLFVMSDLVKFAKMTVSDDDNVKAVPSAVRFVTSTWKSEEEDNAGKSGDGKDGGKKKEVEGNVL